MLVSYGRRSQAGTCPPCHSRRQNLSATRVGRGRRAGELVRTAPTWADEMKRSRTDRSSTPVSSPFLRRAADVKCLLVHASILFSLRRLSLACPRGRRTTACPAHQGGQSHYHPDTRCASPGARWQPLPCPSCATPTSDGGSGSFRRVVTRLSQGRRGHDQLEYSALLERKTSEEEVEMRSRFFPQSAGHPSWRRSQRAATRTEGWRVLRRGQPSLAANGR
jgi:hypothetical protein